MSNLKLKKRLKINVKKMLINESKELSAENIDKWKAISYFLENSCLECDRSGNTTLHLQLTGGNKLLKHAESRKQGYVVITTSDVQVYARNCGLKYSVDKNSCSLSW